MKIQTAFTLTAFGLVLWITGCLTVEVLLDRGGPRECALACSPDRVMYVRKRSTNWRTDRATICSCWNDERGVWRIPLDDLG